VILHGTLALLFSPFWRFDAKGGEVASRRAGFARAFKSELFYMCLCLVAICVICPEPYASLVASLL